MSRYWLFAIGGGVASLALLGLAMSGSLGGVVFLYFVTLPLFLVGFGLGLAAGATASITATIGLLIPGGIIAAAGFFILTALPAVVLIRHALLSRTNAQGTVVWYPAGLLVITISVVGAGVYTLAALWFALQPSGFEGSVRDLVKNFMAVLPAAAHAEQREIFAEKLTAVLPGLIAAQWFIMIVINASLAQKLLVRFQGNIRPTPEFISMEFPNWFPVVVVAAAVVGLLLPGALGFYGTNLSIILIIPFFLMGLAVVHTLCRQKSAGPFMLVIFYLMLIFFGWLVIIVAALGLVEQWIGLRRRFV